MNIRRSYIRLFTLLTGLALCITFLGSSCAFAETVSKPDRWQNEYQAYGRTIKVDVNISMPEKDVFPLLAIDPMPELSAEDVAKYKEIFNALDIDKKDSFKSRQNTIVISYHDHKFHPDLSDAGKVTTPYRTELDFDRNTAYTEDNDLTIDEAENLIRKNIQTVYPLADFQVQDIIINDRTKYRKSGKKLADKGYYELDCIQVVDGIPVAASIHDAARYDRSKRDHIIASYGSAYSNVTDQNNFSCSYQLWNKTAELGAPDHLLPFDAVKPAIEEMIMSGNIRYVHHIYWGYAQYDLPEGSKYEYVLVPAWIVWVDWADDSTETLGTYAVNGTGLYMEWDYYKPIIINAVTGEATNPNSINSMLLPDSYMQWVEGY